MNKKSSKYYIIFILIINIIMFFVIAFTFLKRPDIQTRSIDIFVIDNNSIPVYNADVTILPYVNEIFPHYAINIKLGKTNKNGMVQWNSGKDGKHKVILNLNNDTGYTYDINVKDNMDTIYITLY